MKVWLRELVYGLLWYTYNDAKYGIIHTSETIFLCFHATMIVADCFIKRIVISKERLRQCYMELIIMMTPTEKTTLYCQGNELSDIQCKYLDIWIKARFFKCTPPTVTVNYDLYDVYWVRAFVSFTVYHPYRTRIWPCQKTPTIDEIVTIAMLLWSRHWPHRWTGNFVPDRLARKRRMLLMRGVNERIKWWTLFKRKQRGK